MKRVVLLVAMAALILSTAANADVFVTYYTTGTFSTSGTNILQSGASKLTFTGTPSTTLALDPFSFANLGTFTESGTLSVPSGESFTLNIYQTSPGSGHATDIGTMSGKFTVTKTKFGTVTKSTVNLVFGAPYFTFDGNEYSIPTGSPIDKIAWGSFATSTISTQTNTTLQGIAINTPEPSSLLMLGVGISGLVGIIRRKRT